MEPRPSQPTTPPPREGDLDGAGEEQSVSVRLPQHSGTNGGGKEAVHRARSRATGIANGDHTPRPQGERGRECGRPWQRHGPPPGNNVGPYRAWMSRWSDAVRSPASHGGGL